MVPRGCAGGLGDRRRPPPVLLAGNARIRRGSGAGRSSCPRASRPGPPAPGGLRIAFLVYRGNPHCGGQGVYTRHLTRELVALGHSVEVFAGQPWPELDEGVGFTPVPGLDLYRDPDPFRVPHPREFRRPARPARVRGDVHGRLRRAAGPSRCGPDGCWPAGGTSSTSSTTTSASVRGCSA